MVSLAPSELEGRSFPTPGDYPCGLTWDGVNLWHSDQRASMVYAVDRIDGTVVREFPCPFVRADLAFDGSHLCQVGGRPKRIFLLDRTNGEVVGTRQILPADGRVTGIDVAPEGFWLCLRSPMVVQLRDRQTLAVKQEHEVPLVAPAGLAYVDGTVVVGDFEQAALLAVDGKSGKLLGSTTLAGPPTGLAWDGQRLWYCDFAYRRFRTAELADVLD